MKVNLGCGDHTAPGWINIDNSPNARLSKIPYLRWLLWKFHILSDSHYKVQWPKNVIIRELTKPLPFGSNTVDYIYTSHCIEHLSFIDAKLLLKEIYRVLKPNGIIRIVTPDLNIYIQEYITEKANNPNSKQAADNFIKSLNIFTGKRDPHLWLYDNDSIIERLIEAGFTKTEKCKYKVGRCADVGELDYFPENSLWVEAIK
jgi:predicted SAM-dependent methyltransferase